MEDPSRNQPTRPEVNLCRPEKKVAEEILAEREVTVRGRRRKEFLVKWRGLGDEETSWEKEGDILEFKKLIETFQAVEFIRTSTN